MIIRINGERSNLQDNDDNDDENDDDNNDEEDDKNDKNGHYLVKIQGRISRFCMGVDLENTNG